MPIAENQFLHASVPVRLASAGVALLAVMVNKSRMSTQGIGEILMLGAWDLSGALWLGGTWVATMVPSREDDGLAQGCNATAPCSVDDMTLLYKQQLDQYFTKLSGRELGASDPD